MSWTPRPLSPSATTFGNVKATTSAIYQLPDAKGSLRKLRLARVDASLRLFLRFPRKIGDRSLSAMYSVGLARSTLGGGYSTHPFVGESCRGDGGQGRGQCGMKLYL